ncbi:MAG: S24/S26 family peptidase [Myxococcota bacterium]
MRPCIRPGDLLIATGRAPQIGEIALAVLDSALVTHRVQGRDGVDYVLCADAPGATTHRVSASDVVGTIVAVRRDTKSWVAWLGRRLRL